METLSGVMLSKTEKTDLFDDNRMLEKKWKRFPLKMINDLATHNVSIFRKKTQIYCEKNLDPQYDFL